jgi:hypothetical protein
VFRWSGYTQPLLHNRCLNPWLAILPLWRSQSVWADVRCHVCSNYKENETDYYNSKPNLCWECPFLGYIPLIYCTSAWRRWSASGFVPYFIPTTNTSILPYICEGFYQDSGYLCPRTGYLNCTCRNFLAFERNIFLIIGM